MQTTESATHEAVRTHYAAVARGEKAASGVVAPELAAKVIGYSAEDLETAGDANLGLGCGNPLAFTLLSPGMTVLDLGSGAGFDAFLAADKVGPTGKVIGVDMTDDMLARARQNAEKRGVSHVEFRKGHIEALPVEDSSIDLVISNCVVNLSPDKPQVFREIFRVLKPGGRIAVSDIVLLRALPERLAQDVSAFVGCISGASLLNDYLSMALDAGLGELQVPSIMTGSSLEAVLSPQASDDSGCCSGSSCCGADVSGLEVSAALAARSIASIKLMGRKPSRRLLASVSAA